MILFSFPERNTISQKLNLEPNYNGPKQQRGVSYRLEAHHGMFQKYIDLISGTTLDGAL